MRRVKAGKKEKETKIDCDECGAVFMVTKKDLDFVPDSRDGDFYWFRCPDCKCKQAIAAELIA